MTQQPDFLDDDFARDEAQAVAVEHLHRVYREIVEEPAPAPAALLAWWTSPLSKPAPRAVQGLYLWGGVGRGKTFLMDAFYEALPITQKTRIHFHRFMVKVHDQLKTLAGQQNPLQAVVARFAEDTRIVCFDEFFITDIGDAMIMSGFLEAFFERGLTLVATSNVPPDGLYKDGLQRARFLPAIELLKQHTEVLNVDGGVDYRMQALTRANIYHTPLGEDADRVLAAFFDELATKPAMPDDELEIAGRTIRTMQNAGSVVWFEFDEICGGPRSKIDYIEIARCHSAVLISNIPVLKNLDDQARRFITLVDEFYDRRVKLIVSAAAPPQSLYEGSRLAFEFERTSSRLAEMQSQDYLSSQHMP